jgi:hypothetical protein
MTTSVPMKSRCCFWTTVTAALCLMFSARPLPADDSVAANYVITAADDFVIDVHQNGKLVPESQRHLLVEKFGATSERIDVQVRHGDWLVFHVVSDPMRWSGVRYFAAAGLFEKNEFGFMSCPDSPDWSACDDPSHAKKFISRKDFMSSNVAQRITAPWQDGQGLMKQFAGEGWTGEPLWGTERDTWLKLVVP